MLRPYLLIFFLISLNFALADNLEVKIPKSMCQDVDIQDTNPRLKDHFTNPRSQDSIGWCYGFAAADLISAEVGQPVSASHTSILYNKKVNDSFFWRLMYKFNPGDTFEEVYEGGWTNKAIKAVVKNEKVCLEEDLPFDENYSNEVKYLIMELEQLKLDIENKDKDIREKCENLAEFLKFNKNVNFNADELYHSLLKNNLNFVLDKLAINSCANKMINIGDLDIEKKGMPSFTKFSNEDLVSAKKRFVRNLTKFHNTINEKLSSGKPVAVSYNVKHITNSDGGHASVLTGKRWRNGKCEFKIRNSWGKGCNSYDFSKISDCNSSEGSFWVSDQKFYEMVNDITYID